MICEASEFQNGVRHSSRDYYGTNLGNVVILSRLLELLGTANVNQNVAEHANSVGVATHHHVRETHIVVGGEVSSHNTGEHGLLVELNVIQGLEGQAEVAKEAVNPQKANNREVAQHAIEVLGAILSGNSHRILVATASGQLLCDVGSLDQRV